MVRLKKTHFLAKVLQISPICFSENAVMDYIAVFIPAGLMGKVSSGMKNEAGKYCIVFANFQG